MDVERKQFKNCSTDGGFANPPQAMPCKTILQIVYGTEIS